MKKIVSALAMSVLVLGAVSAADISLEYTSKGYVYSESKTKTSDGTVTSSTKTLLDQDGYNKNTSSDLVISAKSDIGGFVLDVDPSATNSEVTLDEYYGWVNFGNLTAKVGKWTSRNVWCAREDAGKWENADFEANKPGVIDGKYAADISNLTKAHLATDLSYTIKSGDTTVLLRGVLANADGTVAGTWGGFGYNSDAKSYDYVSFSSFAGEVGVTLKDLFALNVEARSEHRDELALGLFFRPLMLGSTDMLIGLSCGADIADYGEGVDHNYYEYAVDFRLRTPISEKLALTTMNNFSAYTDLKYKKNTKDGGSTKDSVTARLWNMVSLAYTASEQLKLQFTVESDCGLFSNIYSATTDTTTKYKLGDLGGFSLSCIPGAVWTFNKNASLTAGLKIDVTGVGASSDYKDKNGTTTAISIPVVFDVAL